MQTFNDSTSDLACSINSLLIERTYLSHPVSDNDDNESSAENSISHAIPNSLIKEDWQLVLEQDATVEQLQNAIERCKELVLSAEEYSLERKWLVHHLVELKFRLSELQDVDEEPQSATTFRVVLGHHFVAGKISTLRQTKTYCDHCTGIIWSVVQASFACADCSYAVHYKCVNHVKRICAHLSVTFKKKLIDTICPEIGISNQGYKCAECSLPLNCHLSNVSSGCFGARYKKGNTSVEARLCDYSGLYYCGRCHWNDISIIPARVMNNWDFVPRKVARASLQEINLFFDKPIINLEDFNPRLFVFVQKLSLIRKIREDLNHMIKYLCACRLATKDKILDTNNTGLKRYLIQSHEFYSVSDLILTENGQLIEVLNKIYDLFDKHIRKCQICTGKGYICEICSNDQVIFPFDDGCVPCKLCNSVYHRACWLRKNMNCVKCQRINMRRHICDNNDNIDEALEKVVSN